MYACACGESGRGLADQKQAVEVPHKFSLESNINRPYNTAVKSPLYDRYQN